MVGFGPVNLCFDHLPCNRVLQIAALSRRSKTRRGLSSPDAWKFWARNNVNRRKVSKIKIKERRKENEFTLTLSTVLWSRQVRSFSTSGILAECWSWVRARTHIRCYKPRCRPAEYNAFVHVAAFRRWTVWKTQNRRHRAQTWCLWPRTSDVSCYCATCGGVIDTMDHSPCWGADSCSDNKFLAVYAARYCVDLFTSVCHWPTYADNKIQPHDVPCFCEISIGIVIVASV
jgi:hypothetical protein